MQAILRHRQFRFARAINPQAVFAPVQMDRRAGKRQAACGHLCRPSLHLQLGIRARAANERDDVAGELERHILRPLGLNFTDLHFARNRQVFHGRLALQA